MPEVTLPVLPGLLDRGQRLLGLDLGSKTIGLALSDASWQVASPLETIRRRKWREDMARLAAVIAERGVGGLVLGLPVNMDGSEGPRCQSVRQTAVNILAALDLPLLFWDERLSTAAVERAMIDADLSRRRRSAVIDQAAAAYILQGALDALAGLRRQAEGAEHSGTAQQNGT